MTRDRPPCDRGRAPKRERPAGQGRATDLETAANDDNNKAPAIFLQRLRRQRQVERICRTPRMVAELLDEIGRHHEIGEDIGRRLDRYASIDPAILRAIGADQFPSSPIRVVE